MPAINSNIFNTGTKFIVNEKTSDGSFGPGTTGFISFVRGKDRDFPNVVYYTAINIKRGKSGKERLELIEISTPVFELEDEEMDSIIPDKKRRNFVRISPANMPSSILEMSNIDFLGWAAAYTQCVCKINTKSNRVNAWPKGDGAILNRMLNISSYYQEDPTYTKESYGGEGSRRDFINRIRMMESTLTKCSLSYMQKVAEIEFTAIRSILDNKVGEAKQVKAAVDEFKRKLDALSVLKRDYGHPVAKIKNVKDSALPW